MLKLYLKKIYDISQRGDAREETYYSTLEGLLKEYTESVSKSNIQITSLPKKTEAGNPDFRIWDGKQHIVGYIEVKASTIEDLDRIQHSEQLKRYLATFPNLILTNLFEFRLYRNGTLIDKVLIGRPFIVHELKTVPQVEKEDNFLKLLEKFFSFSLPKVYDAETLAIELAKRTRFLKDEVISQELQEEEKTGKGFIIGFYEAFKKYLITGLSKEEFADLYSQTITYGLFAARTRTENGFNRKLAYDRIPKTIGILRDVFKFISLGDLSQQMEWIIDDISEVLAVTDVKNILHQYFHEGKGKDPVVHFYETFLSEYDPETKTERGVYYTPEPVVSYIVRSLNHILKEYFNKTDGFGNESVTVLDPAAGTLTFLAEAAKLAVEEFTTKYGDGAKENFIKEHIIKNFYAFELMMAPYAVGHLKMSFLLEELGYSLQADDRFKLYLTNTLEMEELAQTELPGMTSLSEESHLAGKVKKEQPILVILGNPPYYGKSKNPSEKYITINTKNGKERRKKIKTWIGNLIEDYKFVDGKPLGEKNPKWLQNDYVKFIRFAQWKINMAGEGILGFITSHSYLDSPTFRGMRQSLMQSFDEIYLLDLHGNSGKKEKCPDESKDENVFNIKQGVAIALFIKKKGQNKVYKVYHSDLWGLQKGKYDWLNKHDIKTTKWKSIHPKSKFYLFIPRDEGPLKQYQTYPKITDIFPVNSVGIVTSRDGFVINADKEALKRRIRQFRDKNLPDEIIRETFGLQDTSMFNLREARENLRKDDSWEDSITKILYRPFDSQWIFYHEAVIERPRKEVMQHMMHENLGLVTVRQVAEGVFNHAFVSSSIIESRVTLSNKGIDFLFPLYLYIDTNKPKKRKPLGSTLMLFEPQASYAIKKPNISESLLQSLSSTYRKEPSTEEIFYYIYAVLYSNTYRTKYAEFLKIDFPRIPFTKDYKLFNKMAEYGKSLVDLHLLKSSGIDSPIVKIQGKGDNKVEKLRYDEKGRRVYFNQSQYFEGIMGDAWQYQIGGYRVCDKWLKDRKGRRLSLEDLKHYCRVVTSLSKTIKIQKAIDSIYFEVEKKILE
jgi:predicted helicase